MIFQTAGHRFWHRPSVCFLLPTGDQSSDCGVSSKLYNASVITVIGEGVYTSGLGTQPWGVPELTLLMPDVQFAVLIDWVYVSGRVSVQGWGGFQRACVEWPCCWPITAECMSTSRNIALNSLGN